MYGSLNDAEWYSLTCEWVPHVFRDREIRVISIAHYSQLSPAGSLTKSNLWPRNLLTLYGGTGSKRNKEPYSQAGIIDVSIDTLLFHQDDSVQIQNHPVRWISFVSMAAPTNGP
eukprot:scaffold2127_cov85-Cylindrotheca_fusiformis.AAC.1